MAGKQVKLFLVDGTPGGLTTAEITNWTGHVLTARRSDIGELLARDEAQRTGVYVLLGEDENATGGVRCYVGEADVVGRRLRAHVKEKDFWDRVVTVTSKDANLTKAHCRYIEARLIQIAQHASRCSLENGTNPPDPRLPEADRSDMEYFIEQLHVVLPVLGVNVLRSRSTVAGKPAPAAPDSPVFRLSNRKRGVDAQAQEIDGEFTVLAGSLVFSAMEEMASGALSTRKQHEARRAMQAKLIEEGSIAVSGGVARVTRDIVFASPSAAGAIVQGVASCNGRTAWVTQTGETFGDWESRGVE